MKADETLKEMLDVKQAVDKNILLGWNKEMMKLPSKSTPKKIEVKYVTNNGMEDRGIQDYWEIYVNTPYKDKVWDISRRVF